MPGYICDVMRLAAVAIPNVRITRLMPFLLRRRQNWVPWVVPLMAMSLSPMRRIACRAAEKTVRVRPTCLVQYDSNRYSVPARFAGQRVSLRTYASRIVVVAAQNVIAEQ